MTNPKRRVFLLTKRMLFPGLDVSTRQRLKRFQRYFKGGDLYTLDVGCGNGAFSLLCYGRGNRVLGIDINAGNIQKCQEFARFIGADESRCRFEIYDAFNLPLRGERFDQIICFEVLEHLEGGRDKELLDIFGEVLSSGGLLHISTPYLYRRPLYGEQVSQYEDGGHVRLGYTYEQLEEMLKASGFKILHKDATTGPVSTRIMEVVRWVWSHFGTIGAVAAWMMLYPVTIIDTFIPNAPRLQIYVMAVKDRP